MDNEINIDKIVAKSKQWTLEGDCTLLQWMNQISNNLEERVTKTSLALNNMSTKLDRTSVALSNVTNNLAALQYSKFVENRVHDDDETLSNSANVPCEDVTDNNNSGNDICSFLKKNLEMMNSCHEAYSISYEDSDDDDDEPVTNVVYRSKNPYESRPLPHIYGSTLWKEKWHIGLCDSDNDFSGDENSEQFSESSSNADDSYESTAPTISEWDSTAWGLNTQHNVERKDMRTPSNDGESSYHGEDYSQSKVSTPRTQRSVPIVQQPIQDQRYYHHVPQRQEGLFDDIFNEPKRSEATVPPPVVSSQAVPHQTVQHKNIISESYIPNEPPPDEQSTENENNRRVGAKQTLNLFDDDEFSSFMDQIVQKATNKNIKSNEQPEKTHDPAKNLFNDPSPPDDNTEEQPKKSEALIQKKSNKIETPNVFNDSDDLFGSPSKKTQEPPRQNVAANLFSDSDDLFGEQPVVKKKLPSPKIEDDIFAPSPKSTVGIEKTKIRNLFDDDDEDDDFDNIFASKPSSSKTFSEATKNLFTDELDEKIDNKDMVLPKDEPIKDITALDGNVKSSFQKSHETQQISLEDSLTVLASVQNEPTTSGNVEPKKASSNLSPMLKKGLFDDFDDLEDENDIFSSKPVEKDSFEKLFEKDILDKKLSTIPNKNVSSSGNEEVKTAKVIETTKEEQVNDTYPSESKLFSDAMTKESQEPPELPGDIFAPSTSKMKTQVSDIFADEIYDDSDIFVSKKSSNPEALNEKLTTKPSETLQTTIKPPIVPRVPVIRQKPLVFPKKPQVVNDTPVSKQETEKISSSVSEDSPRQSEIENLQKASASELVSSSEKTISAEDFKTKTEPVEDKPVSGNIPNSIGEDLKPVPKPKPKVIIEDTASENNANEKPLLKTSEQKPSTIPSYTSLFHDDVPPEDENPHPISNEESPLHTVDDDVEIKPVSSSVSLPYNSLNLFTDVPPDDYFPTSTPPEPEPAPQATQTKRIHSIFYDDFNETMEAGREMRAPSSYLINDEPPPDDRDNKPPPVTSEIKKEKPQVSKLKKLDFQINVGALLPSAKLPSFKKPEAVVKNTPSSDILIKDDSKPSVKPSFNYAAPAQLPSAKPKELPDNILPNLNKDRAKVMVKRRPSTRTGRQERYRQSMIEEAFSDNQEENETDSKIKQSTSSSSFEASKQEVSKYKIIKSSSSSLLENLGTINTNSEVSGDSKDQMPDQATLFKESDNIFNEKVTSQFSSTISRSKLSAFFKDSDSEPENIFETMKSSKPKEDKSDYVAPPGPKNSDSLFDSDGVDENPFGTPKTFFPQSVPANESVKQTENAPKANLLPESSKSQSLKTTLKPTEEPAKTTVKPVSLFGDSDEGSDDLFKGSKRVVQKKPQPKLKTKSSTKQVKPSASLFSSDDDSGSGNDLFGKTNAKTARKKIEPVKDQSSSSNLFADMSDEDSDNLFGTSKKTSAEVTKSKAMPSTNRTQSTKQPADAPPAKPATSSNPLSDLLGP